MKKIVIANDCLKGGGVEKVLDNIVRYLIKRKYQVQLMIPECTQKEIDEIFGTQVKLYPTLRKLKKIKRFSLLWGIDRFSYLVEQLIYRIIFKAKKIDILISMKEGPTMLEVSKLSAKRKYAWIHIDYRYMHWSRYSFESYEAEVECMAKFDQVICVTHAVKQGVIDTIGNPGNLCVKYNPINVEEIESKAEKVPTSNINSDDYFFVAVGRLAFPKNYEMLVNVCYQLEKKYNFKICIIGDGPDRVMLEKKIAEYKIKCITLLGAMENPYPYIKKARVFVSTSVSESYGLAIQEALILGKPVIAVKCPAIVETVAPQFGVIVDNSDKELYDVMERFIIDPQKLEQYVLNIKKEYKRNSMFENRLKDICDMWEVADDS